MTELERKVLEAIAQRKLAPKPAYVFLAKRSVFWALAVVSVLLGALSFALLLFVISDYFDTHWRTLDNIHYGELLAFLPLLWLVLLAAFTVSAVLALRHTRRGYRLRPLGLAAGALALSLILGSLMHLAEVGQHVHRFLSATFESYRTETYVPFAEWSRPDQGYLGGTVLDDPVDGKIQLMDFHDKKWTVDVSTAQLKIDQPLLEEGDIAIRGTRTGPNSFRAEIIDEFD